MLASGLTGNAEQLPYIELLLVRLVDEVFLGKCNENSNTTRIMIDT